ncbi:8669_t:CDS:1 [Paraglomus occultum]|uniref:8669_t:CDS:1 n=1 Tax=Paraglomus occultum TaxID=144539 RepID=A0A9N9G7I1_9GLOM|nr:8669_t:CDS:1 [Paraglomus occultum]
MIAHISAILYIISTTEQPLPKKTLQKGIAACKTNSNGDFLTLKYTLWLPNTINDDDDNYIEKIHQETTYFTTGKFTILPDKTLELVISSCKTLPITKEAIPTCKPLICLLGKVKESCNTTTSGYHMILEVTPYLSADMCAPIDVVLTHPPEGRLKNTFTAARKYSTIHCNGELYVIEGQLYCDVIEIQFVSAKSEPTTPSNIPWKTNNSESKSKAE